MMTTVVDWYTGTYGWSPLPSIQPTKSPTLAPTLQPTLVSETDALFTVRANAYIFVLLFSIYCVFRCTPRNGFINNNVYTPRKWSSTSKPLKMPPRGLLAWMLPLLSSDVDVRVLQEVGLDAFVFLRLIRLGLVFFVVTSVFGLTFLIPLYSTQAKHHASVHPHDHGGTLSLGLAEYTIRAITTSPEGRKYLWVAAFATWLYSAFFMFLLHQDYLLYIELRHQFLRTPHPQAYTVLVERIPSALNNRPALIHYFEKIFPGEVLNAEVVKENPRLESAVEEREQVLQRYERALLYHQKTGKRPVQLNWGYCRLFSAVCTIGFRKLSQCCRCLCCKRKKRARASTTRTSKVAPAQQYTRSIQQSRQGAGHREGFTNQHVSELQQPLLSENHQSMFRHSPRTSTQTSGNDGSFHLWSPDDEDHIYSMPKREQRDLGGFSLFGFLGKLGATPANEQIYSTGSDATRELFGDYTDLDAELGVEDDDEDFDDDDEEDDDPDEQDDEDLPLGQQDILGSDDDATTFATAMSLRTSRTRNGILGRVLVDSLDYYRDELNRLNLRIRVLQERAAKKRRVVENKGNRRVVRPSKLMIAQQLNQSRLRMQGRKVNFSTDHNDIAATIRPPLSPRVSSSPSARSSPPSPYYPLLSTVDSPPSGDKVVGNNLVSLKYNNSSNLTSPKLDRFASETGDGHITGAGKLTHSSESSRRPGNDSLARVSPDSNLRREDEERLLQEEGLLQELSLDEQSSEALFQNPDAEGLRQRYRNHLAHSDEEAVELTRERERVSSPNRAKEQQHHRQISSSSTLTTSSNLRSGFSESDLLSLATVENESSVDSALPWGSSTIPVMDALLRHTALDDFRKSSAFVTFNSLRATMCAAQSVVDRPLKMRIVPAPDPRDVEWKNLGLSLRARITVTWSVNAAILITTLLFGFVSSTLAAATNVQSLRSAFPELDKWLNEDGHEGYVQVLSQLPPILLVILFAVVPPILNLLLRLERPISKSSQETQFFSLYFNFLLVQVFLFYTIAGVIIAPIKQISENPASIVSSLGTSLSANDFFFMQYLAIRALTVLPLELLRVADVSVALLRPLFCGRSKTMRERRKSPCACHTIDHPGGPNYGKNSANFVLCLTIGMCYSVISPLSAVIAGIYFALCTLVYRQQLLFVYTHEHESGGHLWPLFFRSALIGLVIFQFTMLSIFAFNSMPGASTAILPLVVLTVVFMVYCDTAYGQASTFLPLGDAAELDVLEAARSYAYQHPMYLAPPNASPEEQESEV